MSKTDGIMSINGLSFFSGTAGKSERYEVDRSRFGLKPEGELGVSVSNFRFLLFFLIMHILMAYMMRAMLYPNVITAAWKNG